MQARTINRRAVVDFNLRFWLVLFALACSLSLFALSEHAQQQSTSARGAQASTAQAPQAFRIPFELNGNHVFLQGRVNNSEPLWFTLDTGAAASVINTRRARELGLALAGNSRAQGAGGTVESSRLSGIKFSLPGVELNNLTVMALALDSIEASAGRSMDVILGAELFARYVVEVDYASKLITLYEPQTFIYQGKGEILPLTFAQNHPYVRGRVNLEGQPPIEGDFVIDAGSNFALTMLPAFAGKHKMLEHVSPVIQSRARGVGGDFAISIGRVESLELGRFKLHNPTTAFPERGFFGREGAAGNIGGLILRRFKVIFDYSRKRMILEPNNQYGEAFDFDMSGLALVTDSPVFKQIRINRVIEGSPAAVAGLKPEDIVLEVEGRPASSYTLHALREMFRKEGREYRFKIKRGEEVLDFRFKTRRLI